MSDRLVSVADLASALQIAEEFGLTRQAVYHWVERPDFPRPVASLGKKFRVWLLSEVREWRAANPPPVAGHGASAYRGRGCRCEVCRTSHAEKQREERRARAERLRADPTLAPHGTESTYRNWGCRCEPCTAANSAACAAAYKAARNR